MIKFLREIINIKFFTYIFDIIKLSATPPSIIYPYPILQLLAFTLSETYDLESYIKSIIVSFIFFAGVNLWNHINDIEEDRLSGKKHILIEKPEIRKYILTISPILYLTSLLLFTIWTIDKKVIIAFTIVSLVTWIYSDRILFGKKIRRWKDFYLTEVLTYVVAIPCFTISIWTLFAPISPKSFAFSTITLFFMLSGMFLKDIKDTTGDRLGGLKTLGVVFSPKQLIKLSITLILLYYFSITIHSFSGVFPFKCSVSAIPLIGVLYTINHFMSNDWEITLKSLIPVKIMIYSNLLSFIILILTSFI